MLNNKIIEHKIIVGEAKARLKLNERFSNIEINEKSKINENDRALKESLVNNKKR